METAVPINHNDRLLQMRYLWANIAWDLAQTHIPSADPTSPEAIALTYGLSEDEFVRLMSLPDFKKLFQNEYQRVKEMGSRAGYVFRAEAILAELTVNLRNKLREPTAELKDLLSGYKIISETAGLAVGKDKDTPQVNTQVAVQIVVPESNNPKFASLRAIPNHE